MCKRRLGNIDNPANYRFNIPICHYTYFFSYVEEGLNWASFLRLVSGTDLVNRASFKFKLL